MWPTGTTSASRSSTKTENSSASGPTWARPWGLDYVARENAIYMCDGVNNRIVKLNLDGQILGVLSSYGKVQGKLDFPHSIAVDSTGAIYVAEIKNWRVQKFVK